MMKFLFDVFQLAIVIKLGYTGLKWLTGNKKKKKYGKSMLGKIWVIVSMRIHHYLNQKIRQQKEFIRAERAKKDSKVVPLKKRTTN